MTQISIAFDHNRNKDAEIFTTLLKDPRVDITKVFESDDSILWHILYGENDEYLKILMASGRYLNIEQAMNKEIPGECGDWEELNELIERYIIKPLKTIRQLI